MAADVTTAWRDLARSRILVVDDEDGIREMVRRCLEQRGFAVVEAADVRSARRALLEHDVLLVITDISLPDGECGLDLLASARVTHPDADVILMTGRADLESAIRALQHGAYDYLRKPFQIEELAAAVHRAVERRRLHERSEMMKQLEERRIVERENLNQFLTSLATAIDAKSSYTARHSQRVSDLSRLLAMRLGLPKDRVELVALGGRLHDIGKIGVPDAIIDKDGPLTCAEYAIMKTHPSVGDDLIAPIRSMQQLRPMIRWHHESLDGQGYPDSLPGDQVPLEAFIVKVADYWEAITSRRPYRDPMPLDLAVRTLRAEAGVRMPTELVETFLDAIQEAPIALPVASLD